MKELWNRLEVPGYLAVGLLILAALLAYANAWPDALVHDDKFFAGTERLAEWADIPRFFTEDLWAATGMESGFYRPVLLLTLALESRIYDAWLAGYHLDNILLHLLVTLTVYGFLRQVLRIAADPGPSSNLYPLLAALVFAVHPVHTEVVNSIYNRSEMLVALSGIGGLWWFLHFLETRPGWSWSGLSLCYLFALFSKESAMVIPGIAVALVLILAPGPWIGRMRKCLPVFWMLLPLTLYLLMRAHALAHSEQHLEGLARLPGLMWLSGVFGMWGQALWLMAWPDPLLLYHEDVSLLQRCILIVLQMVLWVMAFLQFRARRYGLFAGLVFFYIAILPASRPEGIARVVPDLAERYLYLPAVGLAIVLTAGFRYLGRRYGAGYAVIATLIALMLLVPLTWNRNSDWSSELRLFESEYRRGAQGTQALRLLTAAYLREGNPGRAAEICDAKSYEGLTRRRYANHCAIAYSLLGRKEDTERAFLSAAGGDSADPVIIANLAQYYLREGRREDAARQFARAVQAEHDPALQAYRRGEMLVFLYPSNRQKLLQARSHFAEAVRLQPRLGAAQARLNQLDRALGPP